jgi:AraC-like DNA-binding protein
VSLIVAGTGRWEGGGERVRLSPGDLLVAPPQVRERMVVDDEAPLRHLFMHVVVAGPTATLPRLTPGAGDSLVTPLLRHAVHLARVQPPGWHERACDAFGLLLRSVAAGSIAAPDEPLAPLHPALAAAFEHLRRRWRQRLEPVDVAELAHAAGLSREHFTRLFRSAFGVGPGRAERLLRLERAVDWLIGSDLTVPEIARRAGWHDAQRFSAALRTACGRGPRELRRAWRAGEGIRQVAFSRMAALRAAIRR